MRADARGRAKLMISPPLVATKEELDEMVVKIDQVVSRAAEADLT